MLTFPIECRLKLGQFQPAGCSPEQFCESALIFIDKKGFQAIMCNSLTHLLLIFL